MGGGHYDSHVYSSSVKARRASGTADFAYSADTLSKPDSDWAPHDDLAPKKIKGTVKGVRESRDSEEHPESLAIAVMFDVTGSMAKVPGVFQANLNKLMSLLILKGKVEHPHILVGAIGDATCDHVPFQMSQFESNNLIDEHTRKLVLEGGGGGQNTESYELGLYAIAKLTSIDCYEKRKQKGFLFMSGDEMPYDAVKKSEVEKVFGIKIQADLPIAEVLAEVQEKWNVFFIIPNETQHYGDTIIRKAWTDLLGQNVLTLDKPEKICDLITDTIVANLPVKAEIKETVTV